MIRLLFATLLFACGIANAATPLRMLIASPRDVSAEIAQDLAALAAAPADIDLEAVPALGSDALTRLRYERSISLAIVRADVYQGLLDAAVQGDAEAIDIIRPLRVVMPLYVEEIAFIVRADAPFAYIDEIGDARVNRGPRGSSTAQTMTTFNRLLGQVPASAASLELTIEDALVKLITDRSIDVVPVVAAQPAAVLSGMKPEAKKFVKVLRLSPRHPSSDRLLSVYRPSTIRAKSYPNLLHEDLPALGVQAILVAHDHESSAARDALARFARSLCRNLPALKSHGHAKWREVGGSLPDLGTGWIYHSATSKEINLCIADRAAQSGAVDAACTQEQRQAGACR
ncbi:MAG TPA: TAXI family TRAP transporter solute-binding subunit [Casimicrobiaceae bacterium]|nr:TAXI family TRAP transporter solute-binding subunit [Casimicrobiaceae bacterium]